ncbi:RAMP superfamily CRISPR-associated protein [Microseira sp. BLCC-F43]|jgi:CRISPR-associated protein Csx10|uniref:RAMP superfamily CRISPR-associated protein n=1 Tax=Microseira sp. BLCC-F43 TaxID=3153602 RepID=UPI0035B91A11
MKAITFLLHTKQPILATSLQGYPNSDVSFSYIPGSMIRGVLISRYLQNHGLQNTDDILDDSKFPDVKRLFFDGSTRYLNAYLYSNDKEKRTLPVPRSWLKKKGDEVTDSNPVNIYDFSYDQPDPKISYKSLNESFCTVDDEDVVLYKEKRRINIHNMRDRKKGRGTDDNGAVFRYDALDAGQTFQGVILCDNADDVAKIKPLLQPKDIWLGGSQSAGYGHTEISHIEEHDIWQEVGIDHEYREDRELLRITLLSDLILRDRCGQYVAIPSMESIADDGDRKVDPLTQLLEQLLEVKLEPQSSFISSLVVGGFNRKWGLPLPQVPALAAGSVFVFNYVRELNIDRIRTLENQGIGERRVDGFGRVAVNWLEEHREFKAILSDSKNDATHQPNLAPNTEDSQIAATMAKRLLEQKLAMGLLDKVDRVKLRPSKLSNSQLSRLIIVARQALTEERKNPVTDLLENLPKNAIGQFEDTKVDGKSFKKRICDWLNEPSTWIDSEHLEVKVAGQSVPSNIVEKLKLEYTLRLIMAVAKKSIKENQDE